MLHKSDLGWMSAQFCCTVIHAHKVNDCSCRQRQGSAVSAARAGCCEQQAQLPELMQGHASPDTSHAQHSAQQPQLPAALRHKRADASEQHLPQATETHLVQKTGGGQDNLQLSFSHRQVPSSAAVHCLRCGGKAGQEGHECRFHPALLQDPGPFLYSPEWHACRAAKHGVGTPGCFVRQGHYFPGHAVQATGLAKACSTGCRSGTHTVPEHLQPRTRLPFPARKR